MTGAYEFGLSLHSLVFTFKQRAAFSGLLHFLVDTLTTLQRVAFGIVRASLLRITAHAPWRVGVWASELVEDLLGDPQLADVDVAMACFSGLRKFSVLLIWWSCSWRVFGCPRGAFIGIAAIDRVWIPPARGGKLRRADDGEHLVRVPALVERDPPHRPAPDGVAVLQDHDVLSSPGHLSDPYSRRRSRH